jgi:hypothetical protein
MCKEFFLGNNLGKDLEKGLVKGKDCKRYKEE